MNYFNNFFDALLDFKTYIELKNILLHRLDLHVKIHEHYRSSDLFCLAEFLQFDHKRPKEYAASIETLRCFPIAVVRLLALLGVRWSFLVRLNFNHGSLNKFRKVWLN